MDKLHRTRTEWQAVLHNNPRISELAKEAIQDIVALHAQLTDVLVMVEDLTRQLATSDDAEAVTQ